MDQLISSTTDNLHKKGKNQEAASWTQRSKNDGLFS